MKQELVQAFIMKNGEYFDPYQLPQVQQALDEVDDTKGAIILGQRYQSPTIMLIIAIFLGWERFFLDDIGMGVLKVVTCYGLGIWWLIDIFTAMKRTTAYNFKKFNDAMLIYK
ncbi:MAG: TM2 domain-containing protein [Bacteroidales bacterium]|nr:TM2 domain-containing protein [Bacteroidales bacterium]